MAYESQRTEEASSSTPVVTPPVGTADPSARIHPVAGGQRRRLFRIWYVLYGLCIVLLGIGIPYGWQLWQYVERSQERTAEAQAVLAGAQANRQTVDIKQA